MNTWDEEVALLSVNVKDDDGYSTKSDNKQRTVYANKRSVTRSEFYSANQSRRKADIILEIHAFEYEGEKYVEYNKKRYEVIRTYTVSPELLELTCSDISQGVKNNGEVEN